MAKSGAKIVFGGAVFGYGGFFSKQDNAAEALKVLQEEGVKTIDTAQSYGTSEETLGRIDAASRFIIDTKYPGGLVPNDGTAETVITGGKESLRKLKTESVSRTFLT
jgi:aflatoxin B1 aldehyde reductase